MRRSVWKAICDTFCSGNGRDCRVKTRCAVSKRREIEFLADASAIRRPLGQLTGVAQWSARGCGTGRVNCHSVRIH